MTKTFLLEPLLKGRKRIVKLASREEIEDFSELSQIFPKRKVLDSGALLEVDVDSPADTEDYVVDHGDKEAPDEHRDSEEHQADYPHHEAYQEGDYRADDIRTGEHPHKRQDYRDDSVNEQHYQADHERPDCKQPSKRDRTDVRKSYL